ncbi:MAG: HU family DNA-binding protein [Alphaproteobacteria bacterium]|nr:HU family DNA-binding protein [Alphaproteobacteria bacterium]
MNKNELVTAVAKKSNASKAAVADVLDAFFGVSTDELKKGGDIRLVGWGTFSVSKRAATEGRNPRTKEKIQIPASYQVKFRAGKALKEAVNKKK